ncbi:hypothetical protein [Frankia sp. AvcI1]|uniref:hypothetical protein n=2 Tax=Frankia sp. AvcI1 TaxID=573496 RepID=UPI0012FE0CF5|nr:hypothetical protein [Frankia sp. AvcI1]
MTSTSTPAADPDDLPAQIRDQVDRILDGYNRRAVPFRDELLPPGGLHVEATRQPSGEWTPAAVPALALLRRADEWWSAAVNVAERIVDLDGNHRAELTAIATGLLSEAFRGRTTVLTAYAAATFDGDLAAGPRVSEAGTVRIGDVDIPLDGRAVAGPRPAKPEIGLTVAPGSDPREVAEFLRHVAEQIEKTGVYT